MSLFHIGSELKRFFYGKLPPLGLAVIILLPLIFGGLFVWSYWDPISGLSRLPVALVNQDAGAEKDGQPLKAGDEVTEKILENDRVKFIETTPEEARDGVADGTYYFALEIPSDFSEAAVSAGTKNPHPATMNAVFNSANGFLGQVLGNQIATIVVDTVDAQLGEQVTDNLLVGFNTIGEGMDAAADGAGQVNDGAGQANDGGQRLADGAHALDDGINEAADGAQRLSDGLQQLREGTDTLGDGASQVSGGVDQIVGLTDGAAAQQNQLIAQLVNLSTGLRASGVPGAAQLAQQTDGVIHQLRTTGMGPDSDIAQKLNQLRDGAREIARQLTDPNAEYRAGVEQAVDGSQTLAAGMRQLQDGSKQLVVGASALRDGLVRLDEGSGELALKITDGSQQLPRFPDDVRPDYASTIATPVKQVQPADPGLTTFGVGLAPFFISLGLFMGGTVCFMLLRPLQRRALDSQAGNLRVALASYLPAMLIGWCQATAMFLVLRFAIGLDAKHDFGLWLSMLAISSAFVAFTHCINAFFGPAIGRVLCLILMATQLVSSGGLYPPETQPRFQQIIHVIDPMTYSINVLRQMIVGPSSWALDHRFFTGMGALVLLFVLSGAVSIFAAWRHRIIRHKDLHPELSV